MTATPVLEERIELGPAGALSRVLRY